MARFVDDMPGIEVSLGEVAISHGTATVPISVTVESWPALLWHVVETYYDVHWWQWPLVLFTVAKTSLLARIGKWPASTSSDT